MMEYYNRYPGNSRVAEGIAGALKCVKSIDKEEVTVYNK